MAPTGKRAAKSKPDMAEGSASAEKKHSPDSTDRKKLTHLRCERQRREAINNGYQELKELLPSSLSAMGCKTTNASILFRACEFVHQLENDKQKNAEELTRLKAQLSALEIIAMQYEQLSSDQTDASMTSGSGSSAANNGPASVQWRMFRQLMDTWFESFSQRVQTDDYNSIARTLLAWQETGVDFEGASNLMSSAAFKQPRC
uniref:BHLH domain-containing protein n=1 Tax=Plectus sambesii TaxID=2011161 RepID=A0A914UWY8_9BILA